MLPETKGNAHDLNRLSPRGLPSARCVLADRCCRRRRRAPGADTPDYAAIVAAPDRTDADRQADQRRQPAKMLAFTGVKTGMKVLDMEAGAGYSTELLARAVGPTAPSMPRIRPP